MTKLVKPLRVAIVFALLAALLVLYGMTLYDLQMVHGSGQDLPQVSAPDDPGTEGVTYTETAAIHAARGNIYDINGVLLATTRPVYNIGLSRSGLVRSGNSNKNISALITAAEESGVEYTDTMPVTATAPYAYTEMTSTQKSRLGTYLEYAGLEKDVSAADFMTWLLAHYNLDESDYPQQMQRKIAGVRYELELRFANSAIPEYVFAGDVPASFVAQLDARHIQGWTVVMDSQRVYTTSLAAHLIGYLGSMSANEVEHYAQLGYTMDELVGKIGAEQAFENFLHGVDGQMVTVTDENGAVISQTVTSEAVQGSDVYLSVDIKLQAVAEEALAAVIAEINAEREAEGEEPAQGGAVVVLDVNTGAARAIANYPTFDVSTFYEDFSQLNSDALRPLYNRAVYGTYNPGSTFKLITAYAALKADVITMDTLIEDTGIYTAYEGFQPRCWYYPRKHGEVDVIQAIAQSCNVFFYTAGDQMGIGPITAAAELFGLGTKTGIEIGENAGYVASPETKRKLQNDSWYAADTLLASIGQSSNLFTPVQIADYIATVANGGTRYAVSVLDRVLAADGTTVLQQEAQVQWQIDDENYGLIPVLQESMVAVTKTGTAASYFEDFGIEVASKTGTTQAENSQNSAVFVCYAPVENPEVAVCIVVEKGGSGSGIISAALDILNEYFDGAGYGTATDIIVQDGTGTDVIMPEEPDDAGETE